MPDLVYSGGVTRPPGSRRSQMSSFRGKVRSGVSDPSIPISRISPISGYPWKSRHEGFGGISGMRLDMGVILGANSVPRNTTFLETRGFPRTQISTLRSTNRSRNYQNMFWKRPLLLHLFYEIMESPKMAPNKVTLVLSLNHNVHKCNVLNCTLNGANPTTRARGIL